MKIPKSVRIAGVEYEVVIVPALMNDNVAAYGHIDYDNSRIELSDSFGVEHQKRCRILWHEILHGIREASGLEIEDEERVVEMFARGIYQVLQDNGARFFDLKDIKSEHNSVFADELDSLKASMFVGTLSCGVRVSDIEDVGDTPEA